MITHTTTGNVFADLGNTPEEAENLQVRSDLLSILLQYMEEEHLADNEAATAFGVDPSCIESLRDDRIDLFSVDDLLSMTARARLSVNVSAEQRKAA